MLNRYNFKTWYKFSKFVTKRLKRFKTKFAMVVKKCKQGFVLFEENTWCEIGSPQICFLELF